MITITIPVTETERFWDALRAIRERYGLNSNSSAIRYAVYKLAGIRIYMFDGRNKIVEVK